ncbi:hypothetical protein WJX84_009131, partial [Apatococcus fuscideae]
ACLRPPNHCCLLCEYMPGGTMSVWLHGPKGRRFAPSRTMEERLQMLMGVARGMQAMEESNPPILHRDLKPSNVFIDAGNQARVADMGLARQWTIEAAPHLTGETGTYMYMSPEMVRHEMYDSRSDVYSWGVMLAETLRQKMPYDGVYLTPVQIALAVADDELRPDLPSTMPRGLEALANACFDQSRRTDPLSASSSPSCARYWPIFLRRSKPQQQREAPCSTG